MIALRLAGPVVVAPTALGPQADGTYTMRADDADIHGNTAKVEASGSGSDIGFWTDAHDTAAGRSPSPQHRQGLTGVDVEYACNAGADGSTYTVGVDGSTPGATGTVRSTGSWSQYRTVRLDGTVTLAAGKATLRLVPQTMPGFAVMNFRSITLTPVSGHTIVPRH